MLWPGTVVRPSRPMPRRSRVPDPAPIRTTSHHIATPLPENPQSPHDTAPHQTSILIAASPASRAQVRDEWIAADLSGWLAPNRIYDGVAPPIRAAIDRGAEVYIVTTKQVGRSPGWKRTCTRTRGHTPAGRARVVLGWYAHEWRGWR